MNLYSNGSVKSVSIVNNFNVHVQQIRYKSKKSKINSSDRDKGEDDDVADELNDEFNDDEGDSDIKSIDTSDFKPGTFCSNYLDFILKSFYQNCSMITIFFNFW